MPFAPRLAPEAWAEIRRRYEDGESILALSKEFHVKRDTIARHRDREGWGTANATPVGRATARVVDLLSGQAVKVLKAKGDDEKIITSYAEQMLAQAELSAGLIRLANTLLAKALAGDKGTDPHVAMRVAKEAIRASRQVTGLKDGQGSLDIVGGVSNGEPIAPCPPGEHVPEEAPAGVQRRFIFVRATPPAEQTAAG